MSFLTRGDPAFFVTSATDEAFESLFHRLSRAYRSFLVRKLRGTHSRTASSFFDEIAAALQFPFDFGRNWDAVNDCFRDLDWSPAEGILLLVPNADMLFVDDSAHEITWMTCMDVLNDAHLFWETDPSVGRPEPRSIIPFHVVLQSSSADATLERFARASLRAAVIETD